MVKLDGYKRVSINEVDGSSLKTHIEATYGELVTLLGEPEECDGYKVSGEWAVKDKDGNVCTVYDWKRTRLYDFALPSVEVFRAMKYPTTFNIGGHSGYAAENFRHQLELQLLALRNKR
jgi:hypothetical protein